MRRGHPSSRLIAMLAVMLAGRTGGAHRPSEAPAQ
jgi:hypothetical protein